MAIKFRPFVGLRRLPSGATGPVVFSTLNARAEFAQIRDNFRKLVDQLEETCPQAVEYALNPIYERSQEIVPVDTGDLKASGYLVVQGKGSDTIAELGYGKGGNPYYAPIVHEDLTVRHDPPTQAKFLEQPINEQMDRILPRIAEYMSF